MATFLMSDVVAAARLQIQDTKSGSYRFADSDILQVANQVLKRILMLRPDLFGTTYTFTCIGGFLQTLPTDCYRLMDVVTNIPGTNIDEANEDILCRMFPTWNTQTAGPTANWMRNLRNPYTFYVVPPAVNGAQLLLVYAKTPPNYALTDAPATINDAYFPVIVDGVVWLLESVDNEHVSTGRAKMCQDMFMQGLGLSASSKVVTDVQYGGEKPKDAIP
jgi:hypothetical protein